jgi:hypothetical protein
VAAKKRPMSRETRERLAFLKKTRNVLREFGIEPPPYSGWSTELGISTQFPSDEVSSDISESDTYTDTQEEGDSTPSEEPIVLAIPEYIDFIDQAPYSRSTVRTRRPDAKKKYGFYGSGPSTSTRVHAMQWIPTTGGVSNSIDELDIKSNLYGNFGSQNLFGDILIAFARPSNVQSHTLYVYENNTEMMWRSLKSSSSLGSQVNYLSGGRPYQDSDGHRYKELHKNTMDGGYPYDYWIFNDMDRWSTIRPNNERL